MAAHLLRQCPHCNHAHSSRWVVCEVTGEPLAPTSAPPSADLSGTVVGGTYRLLSHIERGARADVYEAEHIGLRRRVALKILRSPRSQKDVARFLAEATSLGSINHPNVCHISDARKDAIMGPYMVLERLVGETLAARLRRAPKLEPQEIVDVFAQLLSGLHAAHEAGILHRDLTPENVFLVHREGCGPLVKIVDFGLAKDLTADPERTITQPGWVCGTPDYMSPEQLLGRPLDVRSELFAVATMLYEALTGSHPFPGVSVVDASAELLPEAAALFQGLPADFDVIVMRGLARKPDGRFASALEFQRALLAILESQSSAKRHITRGTMRASGQEERV